MRRAISLLLLGAATACKVSPPAACEQDADCKEGACVEGFCIAEEPVIQSFVAEPKDVTIGSSAALKPKYLNGAGEIDKGVGAAGSDASMTVTPAATTTYTLTVKNSAWPSPATKDATVTVHPASAITSFFASKARVFLGDQITLTGVYASELIAALDNGLGQVLSGFSVNHSPTTTTTYTLSVPNVTGAPVTAEVTVIVDVDPVVITDFHADPPVVNYGGTAQLSWTYTGRAEYLYLDFNDVLAGPQTANVSPVGREFHELWGGNPIDFDARTIDVAARGLEPVAGWIGRNGANADGKGLGAHLFNPYGMDSDSAGNIYVADLSNLLVRKIAPDGMVTTLAGRRGVSSCPEMDGTTEATVCNPLGIAVDGAGNVYVSDYSVQTIRKVTPAGRVTTIAGVYGAAGFVDGTTDVARFNGIYDIAVDPAGKFLYVGDFGNSAIRRIDLDASSVMTWAGGPPPTAAPGALDGIGNAASFRQPWGLDYDPATSSLYVADYSNHAIRRVASDRTVTTIAGVKGSPGSNDADAGTDAHFSGPPDVTVGPSGVLYVTDRSNNAIRRIDGTPPYRVTTLAGRAGFPGYKDDAGTEARFSSAGGIHFNPVLGVLYVAENGNAAIRAIDVASGKTTTFVGGPDLSGYVDATGSDARFGYTRGAVMGPNREIYVADQGALRKIDADGVVSTVAGAGGQLNFLDDAATNARFRNLYDVAVDAPGNAYVADPDNCRIRKIAPGGGVTTFAGNGVCGVEQDGDGSTAQFNYPRGLALDGNGNLYVADLTGRTLRNITSGRVVTTIAGLANTQGITDATGANARFFEPHYVAVDTFGNIWVTDLNAIRKVTPQGVVTTMAGVPNVPGNMDGDTSIARFGYLTGIAVQPDGDVYVADYTYHRIRKLSGSQVSTVIGAPGWTGISRGPFPGGLFNPEGISLTPEGDLLISGQHAVVTATAPP